MQIPIVNQSHHPLPSYATAGASGMDVRAFLTEPVTLQPMAIPQGWEVQVRPRSGWAIQKGITCLNTPGTIDADYRGEVKVILINLSREPQVIQDGDRIAQLVVQPVTRVQWEKVTSLEATERGEGGFGSTGFVG
jgi:dUTP pyrophosphatase